ncbi:MAG: shikimate dehydrogenase [Anaerolineae bacterium]|nr:shikimate dehydrogenase [Anaerolineae bacterium]MCB0178254.1 shikimate dehydrogenase [Anaerolineae bacterium]MCB0224854.1 shikimate dehydrogenase [Anaerolineae bacterium]MCB9106577.1 shikimate dehydrogenase [Anaerolineales bacterium]
MSNAAIRITGKSSLVGLLGWPVKHSLSPLMHNAAFASLGLEWAYVPLPVMPANVEQAIRGLAALSFIGVNVTVPHKQAVIRYLDELNDAAQITGAVNTIAIKEGKYYGYNTDASGFLNSLIEADCHPKNMRVAVLGAGGAARAVVLALANAEADSVTVFNRTAERAAFLVDDLADTFPDSHLHFAPLTSQAVADLKEDVDLVINTTSVGMSPDRSASPWPDDVALPKHTVVCDLVYNPLETALLARAKAAGNPTIDGLGMLIHQGAHAFEIWTGQQPSIDIMRQAALSGLGVK